MGGIPTQAMRPHMRMDAQDYAERGITGGVGMRRSAANAPVQPWAVPTPTLSAGSRKWAECEMDDPEGNLVIVERGGHESQCPFPQTSTVGSVQHTVLNSTAYGTQGESLTPYP